MPGFKPRLSPPPSPTPTQGSVLHLSTTARFPPPKGMVHTLTPFTGFSQVCLKQGFSPGAMLPPEGMGNVWRQFWLSQWGKGQGVRATCSSESRPGGCQTSYNSLPSQQDMIPPQCQQERLRHPEGIHHPTFHSSQPLPLQPELPWGLRVPHTGEQSQAVWELHILRVLLEEAALWLTHSSGKPPKGQT